MDILIICLVVFIFGIRSATNNYYTKLKEIEDILYPPENKQSQLSSKSATLNPVVNNIPNHNNVQNITHSQFNKPDFDINLNTNLTESENKVVTNPMGFNRPNNINPIGHTKLPSSVELEEHSEIAYNKTSSETSHNQQTIVPFDEMLSFTLDENAFKEIKKDRS